MSEEKEAQIIKLKINVKKPVKQVEIIRVPQKTYNIIRSFVESSSCSKYSWNHGYRIDNTIFFIKPGKWILTIWTNSEIEKLPHTHPAIVDLSDVVTITADKLLMIKYVSKVFDLEKDDLRAYAITSDVPFAYPITLYNIVSKINEYVDVEFD